MGIQGVTLYDAENCEPIKAGNPLHVTGVDENGNPLDLSQIELLSQIVTELKINNMHLAMLTNKNIRKEDIL